MTSTILPLTTLIYHKETKVRPIKPVNAPVGYFYSLNFPKFFWEL